MTHITKCKLHNKLYKSGCHFMVNALVWLLSVLTVKCDLLLRYFFLTAEHPSKQNNWANIKKPLFFLINLLLYFYFITKVNLIISTKCLNDKKYSWDSMFKYHTWFSHCTNHSKQLLWEITQNPCVTLEKCWTVLQRSALDGMVL